MQETTREALDALFTKQKAAFRANNNPSYEQRMEWLRARYLRNWWRAGS
jgi:hypothetical protein